MLSTYPLYSDIMVPAKFMLTNDFITVIVRLALLPVVMVRNTVDVEAEYD